MASQSKPDPIGDLFAPSTPPQPAPVVVTQPTTPKTTGGGLSGLLMAAALFGLLWYASANGYLKPWGGSDQQEQKQDDKKQDDKKQDDKQDVAAVKPGVLYMVDDLKASPIDHTLLVQDVKAMRDQVKGFEFRRLDDNSDNTPEAQGVIKHAESKGIKPPFVAFKPAGKPIGNVMAWPKDKTELLKVFK